MLKSLIIMEKHVKTTMQYHCTLTSMTNNEAGKATKQPELSFIADGMRNTIATLEKKLSFLSR